MSAQVRTNVIFARQQRCLCIQKNNFALRCLATRLCTSNIFKRLAYICVLKITKREMNRKILKQFFVAFWFKRFESKLFLIDGFDIVRIILYQPLDCRVNFGGPKLKLLLAFRAFALQDHGDAWIIWFSRQNIGDMCNVINNGKRGWF